MKPDDYVITSKNKLGKVLLPGYIDIHNKEFRPASVQLNHRVYEIWPENLTVVSYIDLSIMGGEITLTAEAASKLIKVLLRNNIPFEMSGSALEQHHDVSELEKQLFQNT